MNNTICTSCKLLRLKTFRNFYAAHAACQHSHKCLSMFGSFVGSSPSSTQELHDRDDVYECALQDLSASFYLDEGR